MHVFVRDCDETIGWIQERDAAMSSEDYGQDLESVQSLIRRHDGFQVILLVRSSILLRQFEKRSPNQNLKHAVPIKLILSVV